MAVLPSFPRARTGAAVPVSAPFLRAMWQLQIIALALQLLTLFTLIWRIAA